MWDLIVSVPDHCLSSYFVFIDNGMYVPKKKKNIGLRKKKLPFYIAK